MWTRRSFLRGSALTAGALVTASAVRAASPLAPNYKLTILHTNDVHSRIDPFPMDGGRNAGLGGVAARSALIKKIRREEEQVLLLDAGDIFQGTPYFNLYKGEAEIKAMTAMGYDATTIGNHDFDGGMENLRDQFRKHASFPMIVSNYDFNHTPLEGQTETYKIFRKGPLKVGVFGLGIELQGLVPQSLYGNTKYIDPLPQAQRMIDLLRRKGCDLVVCLSHLGYKYKESKISDLSLAPQLSGIDLIIGGHTHTFLSKPDEVVCKSGGEVLVNQVGFAGIQLGRVDFFMNALSGKKTWNAVPIDVRPLG